MDLACLYRNITHSWNTTANPVECLKRILWTYSAKIPGIIKPESFDISFSYKKKSFGKLKFNVRTNDGADAFIFGEVYDHEFYNLPLLAPPRTILDLGANAGFVSVYFSRRYPDAHFACVEPFARNVEQLAKNLKYNQVKAEIFPAAVSSIDGYVNMQLHARDWGHKIVQGKATESDNVIKVPAITISSIMRKLGWDRIDLLKIDIEGYEKELFSTNTGWINSVEVICIEIHDDFTESDLRYIQEKHGFRILSALPGIWFMSR